MPASLTHERSTRTTPAILGGRRDVTLVAILGALTAFCRGIHLDHIKHGTILIHPYYVGFYLASYQDGFRRRALVGSIVRLLFPHALNVLWLNVASLVVLAAILSLGVAALVRLCSRPSPTTRIFAFAFCASPLLAVLVEIIGDTLQIAFLIFATVLIFCSRSIRSGPLRLLLGLACLVAGFFIHEASIFFIAPAIPFLVGRWPRARDFVVPGLVALGCFLLAMRWSHLEPHLTYQVKLFHFNGPLAEDVATPSFRALLHAEYVLYFVGRSAELSFAMKCLKMLSLIFVALVALANCLSEARLRRVVYILVYMAVFTFPLWCIAHDWGRFFSYSVYLAMLLTAFTRYRDGEIGGDGEDDLKRGSALDRICSHLERLSRIEYVQLAALFLLIASVYYDNFEHLILTPETLGFFGILIAGLVLQRTSWFKVLPE